MRIDLGSGYNPKKGYKTCDVNAYCDFHSLDEIPDGKVSYFHIRNVLHHVKDLNKLITQLKLKAKKTCQIKIIDASEESYKVNNFLDKLWYRYIFNREDIYIHDKYRNIEKLFTRRGFELKRKYNQKEKEVLIFKLIKNESKDQRRIREKRL